MSNISAGIQIFKYYAELYEVISELQDAAQKSMDIYNAFDGEGSCYIGDAQGEIQLFFHSLSERLVGLSNFYTKATEFAMIYLNEMKFTDEELVKIIAKSMNYSS